MIIIVVRNQDNDVAKEMMIKDYKRIFDKDLQISYDVHGKPTCNQGYISIAHTEGIYLAAISDENLGIDVEKKDRKISSKLGTIEEWTQKEAYGKFIGVGLNKEIIASSVPKDLIGKVKLSDEYVVTVCSSDKVYIIHEVL